MKILVSNDDGIHAPGIEALSDAAKAFGDVIVMAPDRNRSGASNSLTLDRPIRIKRIMHNHYSVEGTPTDCVHLGLTGFLDFVPDLVISGINAGANLGDDVIYSGTVAAAMEGYNLGVPSVAFSLVNDKVDPNYLSAAEVAKCVIKQVIEKGLPSNTVLNVNIPPCSFSEMQGIQTARLGSRDKAEPVLRREDPRGREIFWIGRAGPESDAGPGTDFHAIANNYVSLTPIHMDLTHYDALSETKGWSELIDLSS